MYVLNLLTVQVYGLLRLKRLYYTRGKVYKEVFNAKYLRDAVYSHSMHTNKRES